jgi:hypothetical protein
MQSLYKTIRGSGPITVVKPGRYVRMTGDIITECPFCGRRVRAFKKNGVYVIHQQCVPSMQHGHLMRVVSREQYFTEHGSDGIFESNYPVIFIFKNINLDVRMVPRDIIHIQVNQLNYLTDPSVGYYDIKIDKSRRTHLFLYDTQGTESEVVRRDSFVQMSQALEEMISIARKIRSTHPRKNLVAI